MSAKRRSGARFLASLRLSAFALALCVPGCTPHQEGEQIVDVEPERAVNTDLTYPKNPERWAYVSSRLVTDPKERFPGYQIVVANPFAAHIREEGKSANRGIKLAQLVYEPKTDAAGVSPGELRRVNLIVRDPERYGATGGWGFASFDPAGRPIAIDPAADCVSCHASGPVRHEFAGS